MRIRWKKRALNHLFAIHSYITPRNQAAAQSVASKIQNAAHQLKQFPRLGHPGERVGILELQAADTTYVLPYRITGDTIEILSVFDQRRNPEDKL